MDIPVSQGKNTIAFLRGELDGCAAAFVREQIDNVTSLPNIKTVVSDLSQLSFTDTTGTELLIGRYKRLKARSVAVFVKNPTSCTLYADTRKKVIKRRI